MAKWRTRLFHLALEWTALAGAWLIFNGSVSAGDLAAGAAAAALGAVAVNVLELRKLARVAPLPHAFAQAWRLPGAIARGTWQLLVVFARQVARREPARSLLFASPYLRVGDDDRDATRRALAAGYTSITPSDVVVDIDPERRLLLVHRLAPTPTSKMTLELGAEA